MAARATELAEARLEVREAMEAETEVAMRAMRTEVAAMEVMVAAMGGALEAALSESSAERDARTEMLRAELKETAEALAASQVETDTAQRAEAALRADVTTAADEALAAQMALRGEVAFLEEAVIQASQAEASREAGSAREVAALRELVETAAREAARARAERAEEEAERAASDEEAAALRSRQLDLESAATVAALRTTIHDVERKRCVAVRRCLSLGLRAEVARQRHVRARRGLVSAVSEAMDRRVMGALAADAEEVGVLHGIRAASTALDDTISPSLAEGSALKARAKGVDVATCVSDLAACAADMMMRRDIATSPIKSGALLDAVTAVAAGRLPWGSDELLLGSSSKQGVSPTRRATSSSDAATLMTIDLSPERAKPPLKPRKRRLGFGCCRQNTRVEPEAWADVVEPQPVPAVLHSD